MKAAIYARFSTEKQSEASIVDQFRVCERIAERDGFQVVLRYEDRAISGGTPERPGYQAMLQAARRREFDVIVAEDSSRLWRLLAEQAPRLAELADLGIHVVTHDLDTRQDSAAVLGAVTGAMAEQYRKEIGRRTRRGLEGRARQGMSAGGRAFGYLPPALSGTGRIEVQPEQAEIVRQIFSRYADGWSPKALATDLNRRKVPSPGSAWKREQRRRLGWVMSAIAGDSRRGTGILNNEVYIGRVVWNRVRWVRSASDSSKRRCVLNPPTEWIVRQDERLRIVPLSVWKRVKARQQAIARGRGERVRQGLTAAQARSPGAGPKYLLSGTLKCSDCGASFVVADRYHYACSSRVHGKACDNDARIKRRMVEAGVLAGIKRELLTPEVLDEARRRAVKALKARKPKPVIDRKRIASLEREVSNLVDAIAGGALRTSPALTHRLTSAESELSRLREAARAPRVTVDYLIPRFEDRWRAAVTNLESTLEKGDVARARTEIRDLLGGDILVIADAKEIRLETKKGTVEGALLRAAVGQQINLVAGARFANFRRRRRLVRAA
jgi:DNA invertase Pin-like site-specific DNA recombinase